MLDQHRSIQTEDTKEGQKGKCTKSRRRQEANRVSATLERTQEMEEKR